MGSYKKTFKRKKASALKKCERNIEIHNTGGRPASWHRSSQNCVCHCQQLPHSITNSPQVAPWWTHTLLEKWQCGAQRLGTHTWVCLGPRGGGHWLILYSSLIARKLHAANKLINCFDPDLVWTTWADQFFPVTGVNGLPPAHLGHLNFA